MKKLLLSVLTIALAITAGSIEVFAYSKGEQDCSKCHTLSADQAKDVLKELIPDIKILGVQNGPIEGFWEISMEAGNRKSVLYVDYAKKRLFAGRIIDIKTKTDYTNTAIEKITKVDVSTIPLENALVMGDKNAKHKVVVFDDPD